MSPTGTTYRRVLLLALTLAWTPVEAQSRSAICPAFYNFNTTRGVHIDVPPYLVQAGIPATYTPQFLYGWGTELFGDVGRIGFANYGFSSITSADGRALLTSPWILGSCLDAATVNSPGDTTWTSLMVVSNSGGTPEWLISTEEDTETCGGGQGTSVGPAAPATIGSTVNASRIASDAPLFVCDYGSGGGGSGGGGSGGGGGTITVSCLYIDYYDGDGTFLYSVEVACWQD